MIDEAHSPDLGSWVASAAPGANTDFPIQNLPFGAFRRRASRAAGIGVAIGDQVVDLGACAQLGLLESLAPAVRSACVETELNALMATGRAGATSVRRLMSNLLRSDAPPNPRILVPMADVEMRLPAQVGDYTDFYASIHHATNVGSMFRPDNPLLPNYKWVPIGYHGRASSLVVSGTEVKRPSGQTRDGTEGAPTFGPSRRLDYELEVGAFIGAGNDLGHPIAIDDAESHVFGLCLVNDWSACDIQTWEYQPLGPFLAKSFATTISPWVVTLAALEPFRAPAFTRAPGDPQPLPYLSSNENATRGGFDIALEVRLTTARMRDARNEPFVVSRGRFTDMYWTIAQLVTHHASNGCNLRPGDLLASGTVSGADKTSRGCLLERAWRGAEPLELPTGETRAFLHDDDELTISGYCLRAGHTRIGFGSCSGKIASA